MKPITAPLFSNNPSNQAAEVINLQDGLLLLLRKQVIHTDQQQFFQDGGVKARFNLDESYLTV